MTSMPEFEIRCSPGTGSATTIVQLQGPLTLANLFEFQSTLRQPSITDTIVDLTGVPYIDSAGLGAILSHWSHTQRTGYKFAVVGMCERVKTLLKITKVDDILPQFAGVAEAEHSFASKDGSSSSAVSR